MLVAESKWKFALIEIGEQVYVTATSFARVSGGLRDRICCGIRAGAERADHRQRCVERISVSERRCELRQRQPIYLNRFSSYQWAQLGQIRTDATGIGPRCSMEKQDDTWARKRRRCASRFDLATATPRLLGDVDRSGSNGLPKSIHFRCAGAGQDLCFPRLRAS
jgi:hypothetical protein